MVSYGLTWTETITERGLFGKERQVREQYYQEFESEAAAMRFISQRRGQGVGAEISSIKEIDRTPYTCFRQR